MDLAKPYVDIGLNTNNLSAMRAFWEHDVGAMFDHVLPIRRGVKQLDRDVATSLTRGLARGRLASLRRAVASKAIPGMFAGSAIEAATK